MGDFESFFVTMRDDRESISPALALYTELYVNRMNGAIIGFQNTSYIPPATNWTTFPDKNEPTEED